MTGSLGKTIDISLRKLQLNQMDLDKVEKLVSFESEVMTILITGLSNVDLEQLLNAYYYTEADDAAITKIIKEHRVNPKNVLDFITKQRQSQLARIKQGEMLDEYL